MSDSASPVTPLVRKGALITFRDPDPVPRVIPFQYNPVSLERTLEPNNTGDDGTDALRISGAPTESIKVELVLDGYDEMQVGRTSTVEAQLAELELLLYPELRAVKTNQALLNLGTIEIIPPSQALTVFVWAPRRVLPIRISDFSVSETEFDTSLAPIRATVSLGMRVLSYSDVPAQHPASKFFLIHQERKEKLANSLPARTVESVIGYDLQLP